MSASKARTSWLQRFSALLAAIALSLLAAELGVRWLRPGEYAAGEIYTSEGRRVPLAEIAHYLRHSGELERFAASGPRARMQANMLFRLRYDRPQWDYFDADGCIRVSTNSLGFRDREFPVAKPPGELRVLALGDSFTYGQGVQLENAWPQVLEERLARARGGPAEVINAGFAAGSHWPPGYLDWLAADGLAFEPELVILGLCLNDMGPVPLLAYPKAAPQPWLGGRSALLAFVQRTLAQRRLAAEPRDFAALVRADPAAWDETQAALVALRDLLATRGVGFVVAVFPMLSQLGARYPYLGLHEMCTSFCAAEGIACVDLLPLFRGRDERDLWVHPTDQHPNDEGQRLFAQGIDEFLARESILR